MAAFDRGRRIRSRCPRGCGQGGRAPASWFPGRSLAGQRCERILTSTFYTGIPDRTTCTTSRIAAGLMYSKF
eukprot:2896150-Prymnesium_polylepis.1